MRRRMKCVCGERPHTQTRRRRRTRAAQRVEASTQPRVLSARCARTLTGHCALALASLNVRCMHCVSNAPRVHGIVVQYGLTLVTAFSALFFSVFVPFERALSPGVALSLASVLISLLCFCV